MALQSLNYLFFLALTALITFVVPSRIRHWILLVASLFFYISFDIVWLPLLVFTIVLVYTTALLMSGAKSLSLKRFYFLGGIGVLITNLILIKYLGFSLIKGNTSFPLGISFFTFLALGYLIDVFLERIEAEKNFFYFALFVSFFPILTAGPIERAKHMLPQFRKIADFDFERIRAGMILIGIGFFKKIVIADSLSDWVTGVYSNPGHYSGWTLYIATILARYQIFADFSGYTDIALGSAAIFGIELMQNFNHPFAAKSIADHWRRWHISLSSWIRDYLFYPLISSPFGRLGVHFNIIVIFLVLGLWHGGTINFVLYGLIQGIMLSLHDLTGSSRKRVATLVGVTNYPKLHQALEIAWTFLILVVLPTIFFRARTFQDSLLIFKTIFSEVFVRLPNKSDLSFLNSIRPNVWPFIILMMLSLEFLQSINSRISLAKWLRERKPVIRWSIYVLCVLIFIALGHFEKTVDFAYRNF